MMRLVPRRTFLRAATGAAIALPVLEAMTPSSWAGPALLPPRFVVFFAGNGTIVERWRPVGGESDFVLDDPTDPGRILSPLQPFRDDLLILSGVDMHSRDSGPGGNPHDLGMGHMLTATDLRVGPSGVGDFSHLPDGSAGGPSIDQVVADAIRGDTAYRSIEFGVRANLDLMRQITSRMCYRGPFEVLPPENDPRAAFDSLFSDLGTDPAELAKLRLRRRSVLDGVKGDLDRLHPRLSGGDRTKIEAHLDAIRELEQSLDGMGGALGGCSEPMDPGFLDVNAVENYPAVGKAQMDLLAMALTCDLTRVASLQWSTAQGGVRFSWLGHSMHHHNLSHEADNDATARGQLVEINRWYAEQFAYLLGMLAAQPEGGGSLLDNTIVLWVNELGNGDSHQKTDIPFVLAGNHAGVLRTGRHVQYDGAAHNDLFIALLHAFGQTDVETFGNPAVATGALPGVLV